MVGFNGIYNGWKLTCSPLFGLDFVIQTQVTHCNVVLNDSNCKAMLWIYLNQSTISPAKFDPILVFRRDLFTYNDQGCGTGT